MAKNKTKPKPLFPEETVIRGVSIEQAAEYLGCTKANVTHHVRQGNLDSIPFGRSYLIPTESLLKFERDRSLEKKVQAMDEELAVSLATILLGRAVTSFEDNGLQEVADGKRAPTPAEARCVLGLILQEGDLDSILGAPVDPYRML